MSEKPKTSPLLFFAWGMFIAAGGGMITLILSLLNPNVLYGPELLLPGFGVAFYGLFCGLMDSSKNRR